MTIAYRGGSFAPPLPPELVLEYRDLSSRLPGHIRGSVNDLCGMMDVFHPQPKSRLVGDRHPIGDMHTGQFKPDCTAITKPAPNVVPLEGPVIVAIDPSVPWDHENEMLKGLFEPVQQVASVENSVKVQAWSNAVISHIIPRHFPDGDFEKLWAALAKLNSNPEIQALVTDDMRAKVESLIPKVNACTFELMTSLSAKRYEPIPRPRFEDTKLRDVAHHLLWHAVELEKDREPITTDKL